MNNIINLIGAAKKDVYPAPIEEDDCIDGALFFGGIRLSLIKDTIDTISQIIKDKERQLERGMDDDLFDWSSPGEKTGIKKHIKDYYVVHAERNAILNYRGSLDDLKGSTLYVTWFPCTECTKEIIQVGIKKVVYLRMYSKKELVDISKIMLNHAGVEVVCYGIDDITKEEVESVTDDVLSLAKKLERKN